MNSFDLVKNFANSLAPDLSKWRQHLHANPELSFQEVLTSSFIQEWLHANQIEFTNGWAQHGIVARIKGNGESKSSVALRADMDALPIQEANKVNYCSKNEGVMHACGHDVHMTCLLGAIKTIQKFKAHLKQDVVFVFQPGEEKLPGGAKVLLEEGALDVNHLQAIYGLHVFPSFEAGLVGFRSGPYMASADEIFIKVSGKGGHAALPDKAINPIYIASRIITELPQIISQRKSALTPSILSIGKFNTEGGATNVIPEHVFLEGTFRAMDEEWRAEAHEHIVSYCTSIAAYLGGHVEIEIKKGYPVLVNNPEVTNEAIKVAESYLGANNVLNLPIRMTSEDFAWYTQKIPGCFFRLGTGNKLRGITHEVHTSRFDIDESSLSIGAGLLASLALK